MLADALLAQHTLLAYMQKSLKSQRSSRTQSRRKWAPVSTAARQEAEELQEQRQAFQQKVENIQQDARQYIWTLKDCIGMPSLRAKLPCEMQFVFVIICLC